VILLDTTVLVYAEGASHPLREPCRALIAAIGAGRVVAATTVEVVQEFAHVRARRRSRLEAAAIAHAWVDLLSPLLVVTEQDLLAGLALFPGHDRLGAFDAGLAAAAVRHGAEALVSADRAFADVTGLHHVVPDEAGVAALLAQG